MLPGGQTNNESLHEEAQNATQIMLPTVALVLAVAVFLLSVGTISWLYLRLIRQTEWDDHKGSYQPSKMEEKILGRSLRRLSAKTEVKASDEVDSKDVEAGEKPIDEEDSSVTLLSITPRELEDDLNKSTKDAHEYETSADVHSFVKRPVTSTPVYAVHRCCSSMPEIPEASDGTHTTGFCTKKNQRTREVVALRNRDTGASETETSAQHNDNRNECEESSASTMLWDYAGFRWPGKNQEDVFTADEDVCEDSEASFAMEDEEDSDGYSPTLEIGHHGVRNVERSYSCYSVAEEECPGIIPRSRGCVERGPPPLWAAAVHCGAAAASTGSVVISDEDEADQGFFGRAQHDESYRQYLESIIMKRKARMYFGAYARCEHS